MKLSIEESGDLHLPKRLGVRAGKFARFAASSVDLLMCASINLLQSRHRLHARSREEMERYVTACETLTAEKFYAVPNGAEIAAVTGGRTGTVGCVSKP